MTINKWRSKCNLSSVVTVSRETVKRELVDASPQCSDGRSSMKCLWTSSVKVLDEMSEMLKESFQVKLTSVLQSQFDSQCAVDDVNVGTGSSSLLKKQDFGDLSTVQSCEEDQFQSDWKESLQTKVDQQDIDHEEQQHH